MATQVRIAESRQDALARLAQVARESGVRLLRDLDGAWYATSASEPDVLHQVTVDRCSCRGFAYHGRCRHVARLLEHLGQLDPEPTPMAMTAPLPCRGCGGRGYQIQARYGERVDVACPCCNGEGMSIAA
jgi:hypothetical protein